MSEIKYFLPEYLHKENEIKLYKKYVKVQIYKDKSAIFINTNTPQSKCTERIHE